MIFEIEETWIKTALCYLSLFSGPILACACAGIFCLIPAHNILQEPKYWYEFQLMIGVGFLPLFHAQVLLQGLYWADFPCENKWRSYLFLNCLGTGVYFIAVSIYYLIWTYILELPAPMAFNLYLSGTFSFMAAYFCVWFRYVTTFSFLACS